MPLWSVEILSQFGGNSRINYLNNISDIDEFSYPDDEIADVCKTEYINSAELSRYPHKHRK